MSHPLLRTLISEMIENYLTEESDYKGFKHHYDKWDKHYVETGEHDKIHHQAAMYHYNRMKNSAKPGTTLYKALNSADDIGGDVKRMKTVVQNLK